MRWVTCISAESLGHLEQRMMLGVAVQSARQNTSMTPTVVVGVSEPGADVPVIGGCEVVRWHSRFREVVFSYAKERHSPRHARVRSGAYLRYEIPRMAAQMGWDDDLVLYTDYDVVFLGNPLLPGSMPAADPFRLSDPRVPRWGGIRRRKSVRPLHCNSGVILFNCRAKKDWIDDFFDYAKHDGFRAERNQGHALEAKHLLMSDQAALNLFAPQRHSLLSVWNNWCAMNGPRPRTRVLHFNGPKWTDFLGLWPHDAGQQYVATKTALMQRAGKPFERSVLIALRYARQFFRASLDSWATHSW